MWPVECTMMLRSGCCVLRSGNEIEWFGDEKDAGAWIQHVYGVLPYRAELEKLGLEIRAYRDRGPKPGDAVTYDGSGQYHALAESRGAEGVLDLLCGDLAITFRASAFREPGYVSCSGGPCPRVKDGTLTLIGLRRQRFWRWGLGSAGAGCGGDYYMAVPLWRWNGETEPCA